MLAQESQEGIGKGGDILEKRKGLEFMAFRLDVAQKHLELAVKKKITPAEDNLIKVIEMWTIGAQNKRRQICSKAEIVLEDLSQMLGYKETDKLWMLLKSLEKKGYITREKTRFKGLEIIGLSPEFFGQILCDKQDEIEKRRYLSLVPPVDNSKLDVDNSNSDQTISPTDRRLGTDESSVMNRQIVGDEPTDRRLTESQEANIVEEKNPLDPFIPNIDISRWQNGESCTLTEEQILEKEEAEKAKAQLAEMGWLGNLVLRGSS